MIEPLLGHHLEEEPIELLERSQRLHLQSAARSVDEAVLAGSSFETEPQSSGQDLQVTKHI